MSDLIAQVEAVIAGRQLLRKRQGVLVAVSGGLDSMVLLHVLNELAARWRWRLVVAHFNHRLRGRASNADERLVRRTAETLGCEFVVGEGDVRSSARRRGVSVEMAAREMRHAFLADAVRRLRIRTLALGHHADDQVELFLLRLLRGAGSDGLSGMRWSSASPADARVNLIRPLLDQSRAELEAFAREHGIRFREDASNATTEHQRNRIRHELLPMLEAEYQPGVRRSILRVMEIVREEGDYVRQAAAEWMSSRKGTVFSELPAAIQRRCVQAWLTAERVVPDFELIEQLRLKPGRRVSAGADRFVARQGDRLVFSGAAGGREFAGEALDVELRDARGAAEFGGLSVQWHKAGLGGRAPKKSEFGRGFELFDADKVGDRMKLRHWRPGDRFQPIGMKAPVKLQDWFTNLKVPRDFRRRLVVAEAADGRLFWVEGLRISEGFKLDKGTMHRIKWEWQRNEPLEIASDPQAW